MSPRRAAAAPIPFEPGDTRGQIVSAAADVFERLGFERTRVEDVLAKAKVSRRTFYKYFGSKEAVLAGVYQRTVDGLFETLAAVRADADDQPLAMLEAGVDLYLDFHLQRPKLLRVLVEQSILSHSPLARTRARFRETLFELLTATASGMLGREVDRFVPIALVSALEGCSLTLLEKRPTAADVERAKHAVHGLLRATLTPDKP